MLYDDILNRAKILQYSILLENLISYFVSELLSIKKHHLSISFGNTSKALSFTQKINLLIDMQLLNSENKTKFITFMEVRNQFIHNIQATSFEKCFSNIKGKDTWLLNQYPVVSKLNKEEKLSKAFYNLAEDVLKITYSLSEDLMKKRNHQNKVNTLGKINEAYQITIKELDSIIKTNDKFLEVKGDYSFEDFFKAKFKTNFNKLINKK